MNAVSNQAREASLSDAVFSEYWQKIRDTLVRLGGAGYEDVIDEMKNQEMNYLDEEHFIELFKQWKEVEDTIKVKLNELEIVMRSSGEEGENSKEDGCEICSPCSKTNTSYSRRDSSYSQFTRDRHFEI